METRGGPSGHSHLNILSQPAVYWLRHEGRISPNPAAEDCDALLRLVMRCRLRLSRRLKEDLDSTTSHLLHLSLGNFVCRQVRILPAIVQKRSSVRVRSPFPRRLSAGSPQPAADRQGLSQRLQRDDALRGGRQAAPAPPAGHSVSQRHRVSALEPRADGERHAATGRSYLTMAELLVLLLCTGPAAETQKTSSWREKNNIPGLMPGILL